MTLILTQVQKVPIQPDQQVVVCKKDSYELGIVMSSSLYAASTSQSKAFCDDQALVGYTRGGFPFLLCVDGFHGCDADKVFAFIEKEALSLVEIFQQQLEKERPPEEVIRDWQNSLFNAKQNYLNQGIDFTIGAVATFSVRGKSYAAGWSIGDIGMICKTKGQISHLLPIKRINGFKDALDDVTCQNPSTREKVIKRSGWFCEPIEVGDEIVAFTYIPENLLLSEQVSIEEDCITLAKLDLSQLNKDPLRLIDQLWNTLYKSHQTALEIIKQGGKEYRIGDDCTLCQIRFPSDKLQGKMKMVPQLEHASSSRTWNPFKAWAASLNKSPSGVVADLYRNKQQTLLRDLQFPQLESQYSRKLTEAIDSNSLEKQVESLEKLGDLLARNGQWEKGLKLLNCALAIQQKLKDQKEEQRLLSKLQQVETLFVSSRGISSKFDKSPSSRRDELQGIRQNARAAIDLDDWTIWKGVHALTDAYIKFFASLILEAQSLLGKPPVEWAVIGMGSMARHEMCTFSDIECAFVIETKMDDHLDYFRALAKLVELMVINLGETKFPLYRDGTSPTISGFSMDTGGNTPLGKPGLYELIDTPQGLAGFQSERWMNDDVIVMNALNTVCHVAGNKNLFNAYLKEKGKALDRKSSDIPLRETIARTLLKGGLDEFKPDLSLQKEKEKAFGIKKELYRPFQEAMNCLALFYSLESTNTLDRIKELVKRGVFNKAGAENLKNTVETIVFFRMQAHNFYGEEKEFLCHLDETEPRNESLLYLDEKSIKWIREIYMALVPFYNCLKLFYMSKNKSALNDNSFFERKVFEERPELKPFGQNFSEAEVAYHQAIATNPNDTNALIQLSRLSTEFGKGQKALEYAEKALAIAKESSLRLSMALCYKAIGYAYADLLQFVKAHNSHVEALSIYQENYGKNHKKIAKCYYNMAYCRVQFNDFESALKLFRNALEIYSEAKDQNNIMICYNGLGMAFEGLNQKNEAWDEGHNKALKIVQESRWRGKKTQIADCYGWIGDFLYRYGQYKDALNMYIQAENVDFDRIVNNSQKPHPKMALRHLSIGKAHGQLQEYEKALLAHQKALHLLKLIYGEEHEKLISSHTLIGNVLSDMKKFEEALEYEQKNLKIILTIEEDYYSYGVIYTNLGYRYEKLNRYSESLEHFQKALENLQKTDSPNEEKLSSTKSNIERLKSLMEKIG